MSVPGKPSNRHLYKLGPVNFACLAAVAALAVLLTSCGPQKNEAGDGAGPLLVTPQIHQIASNADPWVLSDSGFTGGKVYLGNGYVGFQWIGPGGAGPTSPSDGEYCLVAGAYSSESLMPLPDPVSFRATLNSKPLEMNQDTIGGYRQSLDMRTGELTVQFSVRIGSEAVPFTATVFPSRVNPHLVVTHITGGSHPGLAFAHPILSSAATAGKRNAAGDLYEAAGTQSGPTVAMRVKAVLAPGSRMDWTGYTAIETSDDSPDPAAAAAKDLAALSSDSYKDVEARHRAAWQALWRSDISIDGDPASQQMAHAALFYLLESVRAGSRWSVPPMGLSNTNWGGHIFWDAEMWMFPALILLHPSEARAMVDYRVRMLPAAEKLARKEGLPGASYPWESARSGGEQAEATYSHERHVTGDVANMIWTYYLVTGDRNWLKQQGWPVLRETADYWRSRMEIGPDGAYHIRKVVGPDETAGMVDDDAFTNGVAQQNLKAASLAAAALGLPAPANWTNVRVALPRDPRSGTYLAHAGYTGSRLKQADPSLLIYPLGIVRDPATIQKMLTYYPGRISRGGPAMTDSIYATISARQGDTIGAMKYFNHSYQPFLVPPFDQLSEKQSTVRQYCFVTGLGGMLQSLVYGFGGVNVDEHGITAYPHLPAKWKRLRITGLHYRNSMFDLEAGKSAAKLNRVSS